MKTKKHINFKPVEGLRTAPVTAPVTAPSLTNLIETRVNKKTRLRDFLTTLPITNKIYQISTKRKKELGTEGLKNYLVSTGEYIK